MRKLTMMLAAAVAALFMAPAAQAQNPFGTGLEGDELKAAIAKAEEHPLGSAENPVRVNMPRGEHMYLRRLRCADGKAPAYDRRGNVGIGIYGNIVDLYDVRCEGQEPAEIYMDMYFAEEEKRPVPGFTIVE